MRDVTLKKLVISAAMLTVAMLLPLLTGQIPEIGSALAPMHIPVLICGFACGWKWGGALGFIAPLFRSIIFGMPPFWPTALAMAFELAAYGIFSGLFYRLLPQKYAFLYISLTGAMLGGRVVWGAARAVMSAIEGSAFTFEMFLAGGFLSAVPGIILHIAVIPPVVYALRRARLVENS